MAGFWSPTWKILGSCGGVRLKDSSNRFIFNLPKCEPCTLARKTFQPVQTEDRHGNRPELRFDLPAEHERTRVEQHVAAAPVDIGKEHRLDQAAPVVEGGELHRLVLRGVHRLRGGEHSGTEHPLAHVAVERGGGKDSPAPQLLPIEGHGVAVGREAEQLVLDGTSPLGTVLGKPDGR